MLKELIVYSEAVGKLFQVCVCHMYLGVSLPLYLKRVQGQVAIYLYLITASPPQLCERGRMNEWFAQGYY